MSSFTLTLDEREREELMMVLNAWLKDIRVEVHRTHTPGFRENVQQEEAMVRRLLDKVRDSAPAMV